MVLIRKIGRPRPSSPKGSPAACAKELKGSRYVPGTRAFSPAPRMKVQGRWADRRQRPGPRVFSEMGKTQFCSSGSLTETGVGWLYSGGGHHDCTTNRQPLAASGAVRQIVSGGFEC